MSQIVCPKCGNIPPKRAQHCNQCGEKLPIQTETEIIEHPQSEQGKRWEWLWMGLVLLIMLCGASWFILQSLVDNSNIPTQVIESFEGQPNESVVVFDTLTATAVSENPTNTPIPITNSTPTSIQTPEIDPTQTATAVPSTSLPPTNTVIPPTATETAVAFDINSGRVAYSGLVADRSREIFYYEPAINNITQVTSDGYTDFDPAWSPDGTKIAYSSVRNSQFDIYIADLLSDTITRLTTNPGDDSHPDWSPDGNRILFHSNRDGEFDIYIINADGTNLGVVANSSNPELHPSWSPDGQRILFTKSINGLRQIYTMNLDGSDQRHIASDPIISYKIPTWSPDGTQIAFYHGPPDGTSDGIMIINADGSNIRPVTTDRSDFDPDWSPDGEWIIFHRKEGANRTIYRIRPDGSELTLLIGYPTDSRLPDWYLR